MRPGQGLAASASRSVLGGDLGVAVRAPLAGRGLESRGPGPGAGGRARPLLTRQSGLSRGRRSGLGWVPGSGGCGRLRPPWPGPAASRRPVSGPRGPGAASRRRRRRGPWSRAAPGGRAGPGGRADQRTGGPMDHSAAASLPRYGASEGQARPARPRARPRVPRLQRARTRGAPPTPAPARGGARRSEGTAGTGDRRGAGGTDRAHPRDWIRAPKRRGCGWAKPIRRNGAAGLARVGARTRPKKGSCKLGRAASRREVGDLSTHGKGTMKGPPAARAASWTRHFSGVDRVCGRGFQGNRRSGKRLDRSRRGWTGP